MTAKKEPANPAGAQAAASLNGSGNFNQLITSIEQAHSTLAVRAAQAVNISLTLRNWLIGLYIAEFELQGADRAQYGNKLIDALETALQQRAVSNCGRRQLYNYLTFYRAYPQIVRSVTAQSTLLIPDTAKNRIVPSLTAQLPTDLTLDPELLLSRLSYTHFNSYVGYYRQEQMTAGDQAPIGILLCTGKNEDMVQYALSGMTNNLFVSRYQLALPGKEEIAAFLQRAMRELAGMDNG